MSMNPDQSAAKRWLLVDDDANLLRLTATQLELASGLEIAKYESPHAALDQVRRSPENFECIVTDRHMPGMLGEDLLGELLDLNPAIRAIVVTGDDDGLADALDRRRLSAAILRKPFTFDQLKRAVGEAPGLGDRLEIMELWSARREMKEATI